MTEEQEENFSKQDFDRARRSFMKKIAAVPPALMLSASAAGQTVGGGGSGDTSEGYKPEQHRIRIEADGTDEPQNYYLRTKGPISSSELRNPETGTKDLYGGDAGEFVDETTIKYRYGRNDSKEEIFSFDSRIRVSSLTEVQQAIYSGEDVLIEMEPGEYRFGTDTLEKISGYNDGQNIGIMAPRGEEVRLIPPEGSTDLWGQISTSSLVLHGIDIDFSKVTDSAPTFQISVQEKFAVANMERIGRAGHSSERDSNGLALAIEQKDGIGIVRNYYNPEATREQAFDDHDGRYPFFVSWRNYGTVELIDCTVKEANSYGIYGSGSNGPVNIRGGVWGNNSGFNLRIPNGGTVENTYIYHDWNRYTGPLSEDDADMATGIFFETKYVDKGDKKGLEGEPVTVRNCRIELMDWPGRYRSGILVNRTQGELIVEDTTVVVESPEVDAAIRAAPPDGTSVFNPNLGEGSEFYHEPVGAVRTYVENSVFQGNTSVRGVVSQDRENSEVVNCRVEGFSVGIESTGEVLEATRTDIEADQPTQGMVDWVSEGADSDIGSTVTGSG